MEVSLERPVELNRTFILIILLQMIALGAATLLPSRVSYLAALGMFGLTSVILLPIYPQILFPFMILTTALDISGQITELKLISLYNIPITGFHIAGGGAIAFCVANIFLRRRLVLPRLEVTLPLMLLLADMGIAIIYSPNREDATVFFFRYLFLSLVIYVTAFLIDKRRDVNLIIASIILCGLFTSGLGIFQSVTEGYYLPATFVQAVGANIPRAAGTFHNPNSLATFLMIGIVLSTSIFAYFRLSMWTRFLIILTVAVLFGGLVATFSRSNWLATMVGVLTVVILSKRVRLLIAVGVVSLSIMFAISLASSNFAQLVLVRFQSIFRVVKEFNSIATVSSSARVYFIIAAMKMFLHNPLFGIGFRGFPVMFDLYKPKGFPIWLPTRESHTLPATILAELGIVGFSIFLWFIFVIIKVGLRAARGAEDSYVKGVQIGLISTFIALQVSMLFTADFTNNFFWIITGLIFAVDRMAPRDRIGRAEG